MGHRALPAYNTTWGHVLSAVTGNSKRSKYNRHARSAEFLATEWNMAFLRSKVTWSEKSGKKSHQAPIRKKRLHSPEFIKMLKYLNLKAHCVNFNRFILFSRVEMCMCRALRYVKTSPVMYLSLVMRNLFMPYANNKGADQPAYL